MKLNWIFCIFTNSGYVGVAVYNHDYITTFTYLLRADSLQQPPAYKSLVKKSEWFLLLIDMTSNLLQKPLKHSIFKLFFSLHFNLYNLNYFQLLEIHLCLINRSNILPCLYTRCYQNSKRFEIHHLISHKQSIFCIPQISRIEKDSSKISLTNSHSVRF